MRSLDVIGKALLSFIRRHPRAVTFLLVYASVMVGLGLGNMSIDATAKSLLLADDPDLSYYDDTRVDFDSDEYIIVSVTVGGEGDHLITPEHLAYLEQLGDQFEELDYVKKVDSVLDMPLFRSPIQQPPAALTLLDDGVDLEAARGELTQHEIAADNLISRDARTANLLVHVVEYAPGEANNQQRAELARKIREAERNGADAAELKAQLAQLEVGHTGLYDIFSARRRQVYKQVEAIVAEEQAKGAYAFHMSGLPMMVNEMVDSLGHDIRVFGLGSLLLMAGVMLVVFRDVRWVLIPLLICSLVVTWVVATMGWYNERLTLVTANIVSLLFVVSMAHSIHLVVRHRELQRRSGAGKDQTLGLLAGVRTLWRPCLFTALTTAVGFAALTVSNINPVINFGLFMAYGVILALVLTFVAFPAMMMTVGLPRAPKAKRSGDVTGAILGAAATVSIRGRRLIPILMIMIGAFISIGVTNLSTETRIMEYFQAGTPIRNGLEFIDDRMGGTSALEVIIEGPEPGYFDKRENCKPIAELTRFLRGRPTVGSVVSIHSIHAEGEKYIAAVEPTIPLIMRNMAVTLARRQIDEEANKQARAQAFVSSDGSAARVIARVRENAERLDRSQVLDELDRYIAAHSDGIFAGLTLRPSGIFVLYSNMINSLVTSQIESFALVFAGVFVMLLVLFRSPLVALVGMVPNAVPVLVILGVMGFFDIALNVITITIASIALGLAVDGTIHYVTRLRAELRESGGDWRASIRTAHLTIGRAIFVTSIAIVGGLLVMMLSDFVPTSYFGLFTALALVAALIGNLTVLPATLILIKPRSLMPKPETAGSPVADTGEVGSAPPS
jgi:predicted RND superfamily exporter protein